MLKVMDRELIEEIQSDAVHGILSAVAASALAAAIIIVICVFSTRNAAAAPVVQCADGGCIESTFHARKHRHKRRHKHRRYRIAGIDANGSPVIIGGRPAGCPRAYCGCGLRLHLGINDTSLNLAWNWARKLPRTHAHAGAVAVWPHHVALIEQVGDGQALMRDYNSGGGLSRLHWRSLAGAVFVDPRSRLASR